MDSDAVLAAGEDRPGKRSRTFPRSLSDWVMIDCFLSDSDSCGADSSSVILAHGYTSTGDRIGVGLRPVRPPAISCLVFDWRPHPERAPTCSKDPFRPRNSGAMAVAAHRNSIFLRFVIATGTGISEELFVYQVCPRSASPASLQGLPACRHVLINRHGANNVGILCHGDNRVFAVAHLIVTPKEAGIGRRNDCPVTATLCYIRSLDGSLDGSWRTIKGLPIRGAEGRGDDLVWWETDVVVPFGDYICWVDYLRGMPFCDVFSTKPELHYVALPVDPYQGRQDPEQRGRGDLSANRTVCVTKEEGGCVIRFVDVTDNRCWFYGRPRRGSTSSPYSTISSWRLNSDMRTWKLDSMIEDEDFLTLTKRHNLPCGKLSFPIVDLNDPQTIYCAVTEEQCTFLMTVNMSTWTLVKTPYTFGSGEPTGKGGSYKGKHSRNLDYSEPFLPCELISNEPSGGGDSYNNSNV